MSQHYTADTLRAQLAKVTMPSLQISVGSSEQAHAPTSLEQARQSLADAGLSIAEWSRANNFSVATTKAVLYGNNKGLRGESHRVAVALGIKSGVVVLAKGFVPVRRIRPPLKTVKSTR